MKIRAFKPADRAAVVALWQQCGLTRPWNDPHADIARKLSEQPELFLVGTVKDEVVATAMAGFDGHRGWVYYLAVASRHRWKSYGVALMQDIERRLKERGCPKLNLQVRSSNAEVLEFYRRLGYTRDETVGLGKRLIHDRAPAVGLSYSFAPIAGLKARILILGSMPGRESLKANQYYAHPRNAFWSIMTALLRIDPQSSYDVRTKALRSAGIALWDVLHSCKRDGSLDASIEASTESANDFRAFLRKYRAIKEVFFNGAKAESAYLQHVRPAIEVPLRYTRLPSTSPAHASVPFAKKLAAWRVVLPA